jgi:hypothetical protein
MSVVERELRDFEKFVLDAESESTDLQLEDWVCLWRATTEKEATRAAIQEGFDGLNAGRVRPAADVLAELRQSLGS